MERANENGQPLITVKPQPARWPRLLDDRAAAEYLGLSRWTIRDYIARGLIAVVDLPPLSAREGEQQRDTLRRVLIDLENLNSFVDEHKGRNR
jgi:hypothetical protein